MYFLSCDIKTGRIIGELPLSVQGSLQRAMMTVTDGTFMLPITDAACPPDWEGMTDPWRVVLVVVDDGQRIVWAGIPSQRIRQGSSVQVKISAVSIEGYLDRRYAPTRRFDQVDQCDIAAWLVQSTVDAGIPIEVDCPPSGVLRDREYHDDDSATILKRLEELSEVINGPEWWVETKWADDSRQAVKHVFHCSYPRIGLSQENPQAAFEMPGGLQEITEEERWGTNDAATFVVTYGEGEGEDKPRSSDHVDVESEWAGYPRLEMRPTAQNTTEKETLEAKSAHALERFRSGTRVMTLKQIADRPPFIGVDWQMGDDVRVVCNTPALTVDQVLRLVGWEIDANGLVVTPIVASISGKKNGQATVEGEGDEPSSVTD